MLQTIEIFVSQNLNYILGVLGVFSVAAINALPEKIPSTIQEIYLWLRDSLQTALPINRR